MAFITNIGGVFIHANDMPTLAAWYRDKLQLPVAFNEEGNVWYMMFSFNLLTDPPRQASTVFAILPSKTPLPPKRTEMGLNFQVEHFFQFLEDLKSRGVEVEKTQDYGYGWFGWITDPEGNRIEFWEPKEEGNKC